ncbi:MAG TPA: hypothetical protein VEM93_02050 [Actinomycetota bacterium]|nr:hypothetical protein [Actinomycetota bacterium]
MDEPLRHVAQSAGEEARTLAELTGGVGLRALLSLVDSAVLVSS